MTQHVEALNLHEAAGLARLFLVRASVISEIGTIAAGRN